MKKKEILNKNLMFFVFKLIIFLFFLKLARKLKKKIRTLKKMWNINLI